MLRDIKQKSSGLGAKIIMGLLIIAFAFWGVSGSILSAGNDSAATVNGEKISIADFNQANQSARNRLVSQFGDNLGNEYFDSISFKRGVMKQIVDSELLKQEAVKFDYDVSPSKVKKYIESSPGLQVDGKFSKEAYANFLAQVNKSAELLQRDIKEDIKRSALPLMISQSSFSLNSEVENQYRLSKQKRSFNYLEISSKDFEAKVEVSEEEINSHFNEFGQDYMTTELLSVNYIELSTADLLNNIEISEDDLLTYYEARKATLMTSEKRNAQHILLPVSGNETEVKQEILKVAARIDNGEDFAELAIEISQDPGSAKNGGDLGWVSKGDMVEAFDEKLFTMNVGEISEPVLSSFGYHIIKLLEIKIPEITPLNESRDTLTAELKEEKAEEEFLSKADELYTLIIDSDNVLELAAENSGLEMKSTELFARGRGLGVAANQNFAVIAFSEAVKLDNETSEMIDLGENHIAYLHILEHQSPVIKKLEEVSESILNKLKSEKSLDLAKQNVKEFIEKIKSGETNLSDIATELNKTIAEAVEVERVGSQHPFNLVKNVFSLKYDEENPEVTSVESSANTFALVDMKSIDNADSAALSDDEKLNISSQIERTVSNNELVEITSELRNAASININEKIYENNQ
ncbi:MAG: SurA N-terminal domain-containing protein [Alcanivoracaceae bacterium]|nr:SurA N-terminal domain-containing protein [Alcanivoracaceae bacterium]